MIKIFILFYFIFNIILIECSNKNGFICRIQIKEGIKWNNILNFNNLISFLLIKFSFKFWTFSLKIWWYLFTRNFYTEESQITNRFSLPQIANYWTISWKNPNRARDIGFQSWPLCSQKRLMVSTKFSQGDWGASRDFMLRIFLS
jgi:hypothetical protein